MKKLLLPILLLLLLSACGETEENAADSTEQSKLEIYTTVYPLTYFTERIGGDRVEVQSIYPAGSNEHTFEPTQKDMIALAEADTVLYIGLGLEGFIDKAKETLKNEPVKFVATADAIPASELTEGHTHEETEEHDHEHEGTEEEHDHEHEGTEEEHADENEGTEEEHTDEHGEIDPHVWISPTLSQNLAESIKNELIAQDEAHASEYEENYQKLVEELKALDQSFQEVAENAPKKSFFVSHSAFGYLADAYGLEQVPVAGLNSQDEPSQKELVAIVEQAKELDIRYIAFEQNVSSRLTEVIQSEVDAEAVQLHNLSVLTQEEIDQGETYFTLMEKNKETFEKILK
ncbi:metal ABC transporter solute-binding protein, Zn/Mn family [Planomicrobium sp. CPCC 101079]|uniref:metal ABC transporter solute-binding protein, Zn/Mn family n=1 Tax=Planomicrobium sp. CPCC 101079 TaxID=2599618 RepID=UPI0011B57011|nr:zinc ABC transporter substrate-binding protein [Planomicrobium sp. CPCC 101079]TWT00532.1 adhesin [Planomicrobium sp. CPCC 101079]